MTRTTLPINEIIVLDRQRLNLGDIADLANSINRFGLIQPIVLNQDKRLIAGGRRLAAHMHLGRTSIDVVYRDTLSIDELHELELEENVRRQDMSWQEKALNILKIHELKLNRSALEGSKWGMQETAEMLGLRTKASVSYNNEIAKRLRIELTLPIEQRPYWQCENMSKAWQLRLREEEELLQAELSKSIAITSQQTQIVEVKPLEEITLDDLLPAVEELSITQTQPANTFLSGYAPELPPSEFRVLCPVCSGINKACEYCKGTGFGWSPESGRGQIGITPVYEQYKAEQIHLSRWLHHGSCIDYMLSRPESVDHIITDPPYGIDMDMLEQENTGMADIDTVADEHDVDENESMFESFLPAAYTALKPNGYLIFWCDIMQWNNLYNIAIVCGFKVQRWPITWIKTHICMNQSASQNFTKTTEIAMVCRKGTATLSEKSSTCHIIEPHDDYKDELGHPFVKPFNVWKYLIEHVSYEGQTILEPFSGRGSGVISIARLKRQFIACELNDKHYNALVENVKQHYLKINPNYTFI